MNYTDYVDMTICVNLDRRPERWKFMESQFEREQMEVHRFAGVDGMKRLPIHGRMPLHRDKWPETLTWNQGMAGSAASFCSAIMMAKYCEARTLLYLEDDAVLPQNWMHNLARQMEGCPKDWDIVNFGAWHVHPPEPANEHFHRCTLALNLHCVLIHSRSFDIILAALNMKKADSDHSVCELTGLSYYAPRHFNVAQKVGFSDCHNRMLDASQGRMDMDTFPSGNYDASFMSHLFVRPEHRDADLLVVNEVVREDKYGIADLGFTPKTIIDAGAHLGSFTWMMNDKFPEASIASVEADKGNIGLLSYNLNLMASKPRIFQNTLSYRKGPIPFRSSIWSGTFSTGLGRIADLDRSVLHLPDPTTTLEFDTEPMTVEQIANEMGWAEVDLLKLDIEGEEYDVIEHLSRVKVIIGEFHDAERFNLFTVHPKFKDWRIDILHRGQGSTGTFRMVRKDVKLGTNKSR
ncbi:MAG: hypothetical protein COA69_09365 [Robiginitomaculum sp.]|nr:MAG: hypothetical protein COA69_09365 [Robiginitomaculum sp.]